MGREEIDQCADEVDRDPVGARRAWRAARSARWGGDGMKRALAVEAPPMSTRDPLRVISLGAGVQSSVMFLMACHGEIAGVDAAIFADTQQEPDSVYRYLDWLEGQGARHGVPIYRVSGGDLGGAALARAHGERGRSADIPLYLARSNGSPSGMLRRQCTGTYKITPIRRQIRQLLAERHVPAADVLIGISVDETQRMRDSGVKYIQNVYPLIDRRMTRADCLTWHQRHKFPAPPRSACRFCPYHRDSEWKRLRDEEPAEFAAAVEFDSSIRTMPGVEGSCYVHRSRRPLGEINFDRPEDLGQMDFGFLAECEGMCGI